MQRSSLMLAALVAFAACAEAGGEIRGGDLTEAGAAAAAPPPFDPPRASGPSCEGSGSRWSDLYRDVFGPTGRPGSCSFQADCHGSPDGAGVKSGSGIECFDEQGCRQSLFDKNIVSEEDASEPDKSGMLGGLLRRRKDDGALLGFMPKEPRDFVFDDACVERIRAWIRDGAKAD